MPGQTQRHHTHLSVSQEIKKKQREPFDYVIYFFTIATPLFELPQAYTIYANHSARDVSVWTWSFFVVDNIIWIIYAARKNIRPLLITSALYLIIEISIVIGILHYS